MQRRGTSGRHPRSASGRPVTTRWPTQVQPAGDSSRLRRVPAGALERLEGGVRHLGRVDPVALGQRDVVRGRLARERDRDPVGGPPPAACRCPPGRCPSGTSRPERTPGPTPRASVRVWPGDGATAGPAGQPRMPPRGRRGGRRRRGGTAATGDDQRREDRHRGPSGWPSEVRHRLMLPSDHDEDRLRGDARAVPPDRPARLVRAGRGGRLRGRLHGQRALPSVDAAAGPERVRLGVHGRARAADVAAASGPRSPARASATTRR